jgi:hypothetical protein
MAKLKTFVRLEFLTIKPYLSPVTLLIYAALVLFLSISFDSAASGLGVGFMIGLIFGSYPFAVGEKTNMDAFYTTLAMSRKNVVLGRYLFALVFNALAIVCSLTLSTAGLLIAGTWITAPETTSFATFVTFATLILLFLVIQSAQLPIFFKFGYAKAKFMGLLPVCLLLGLSAVVPALARNEAIYRRLAVLLDVVLSRQQTVIALAAALVLLLVFASYRLSLSFYGKREF